MNKLIIFSLVFLLASCGGNETKNEPLSNDAAPAADTSSTITEDTSGTGLGRFSIYYDQFINSILQNNPVTFNSFIHPEHGLCIIEQNGALPQMKNGKDISRFKTIQGYTLFQLDKSAFTCALKEEALPEIDCNDDGFFTKEGCFTQAVNTFKNDKIWEHCGLGEKEQAIAAKSAETISRTVINTKGYRFYFSQIDNKWFLTFLDLRVPCSA